MRHSSRTVYSTLSLANLCLLTSAWAGAQTSAATPLVSILEKDGNPKINPATPPAYLNTLEAMGLRVALPEATKAGPLT